MWKEVMKNLPLLPDGKIEFRHLWERMEQEQHRKGTVTEEPWHNI